MKRWISVKMLDWIGGGLFTLLSFVSLCNICYCISLFDDSSQDDVSNQEYGRRNDNLRMRDTDKAITLFIALVIIVINLLRFTEIVYQILAVLKSENCPQCWKYWVYIGLQIATKLMACFFAILHLYQTFRSEGCFEHDFCQRDCPLIYRFCCPNCCCLRNR